MYILIVYFSSRHNLEVLNPGSRGTVPSLSNATGSSFESQQQQQSIRTFYFAQLVSEASLNYLLLQLLEAKTKNYINQTKKQVFSFVQFHLLQ